MSILRITILVASFLVGIAVQAIEAQVLATLPEPIVELWSEATGQLFAQTQKHIYAINPKTGAVTELTTLNEGDIVPYTHIGWADGMAVYRKGQDKQIEVFRPTGKETINLNCFAATIDIFRKGDTIFAQLPTETGRDGLMKMMDCAGTRKKPWGEDWSSYAVACAEINTVPCMIVANRQTSQIMRVKPDGTLAWKVPASAGWEIRQVVVSPAKDAVIVLLRDAKLTDGMVMVLDANDGSIRVRTSVMVFAADQCRLADNGQWLVYWNYAFIGLVNLVENTVAWEKDVRNPQREELTYVDVNNAGNVATLFCKRYDSVKPVLTIYTATGNVRDRWQYPAEDKVNNQWAGWSVFFFDTASVISKCQNHVMQLKMVAE